MKASITPAAKKVVEIIEHPAKLVLELTKAEAQILYALIMSTNGQLNYDMYLKFKDLGFDEYQNIRIGKIDVNSIEGKLDDYIIVPKELN